MIKRRLFTLLAAVLLALASFGALTSCSGGGPVALEYENVRIGERMYRYWLSHYKYVFLHTYEGATDTSSFWDSELDDGKTAEEVLTELANENIKRYVAGAWLFDYTGLRLTADQKKGVKDGIEDVCEMMFNGDDEGFDAYLESLGIDRDILYDAYIMDLKVSLLKEYLYGVSGIISVPDSDRMAYLKEKYVRIGHIFVNDEYKWATDEDGNYITDEKGNAKKEELTEEERGKAREKIEAIRAGLSTGSNFRDLWEKYTEDSLYPDGYYLLPTTPFITEVVEAAFELEVDEVRELHTEYGTHFIKRYEMEGTPWDDEGSKDFFEDFEDDMRDYLFSAMLSETVEKVKINEEVTGEYRLREVPSAQYA